MNASNDKIPFLLEMLWIPRIHRLPITRAAK